MSYKAQKDVFLSLETCSNSSRTVFCSEPLASCTHTTRDGWVLGAHETLFHWNLVPKLTIVVNIVFVCTIYLLIIH